MTIRRSLFCVIAGLYLLTSCGQGSESVRRTDVRNAAIPSVSLVNAQFTAAGWAGEGFTLGAGCKVKGGDPSLGAWVPNALSFGYTQRTVSQSLVVPYVGAVVFSFDGVLRGDDTQSTFQASITDADENVSTGVQTGSALTVTKRYSLKVTTKVPNETVKVSISGKSGNLWAGCYGAVISNAAIDSATSVATSTPAMSTTTSNVPVSTTTVPASTTTVPASTSTAPTSTTSAGTVSKGENGTGPNGAFKVGDTGPGLGTVIWSEFIRDTTTMTVTQRYLEVAPIGWSGTVADPKLAIGWCNDLIKTTDGFGAGLANTNSLLTCQRGVSAPKITRDYRGGGKDDWYMPTPVELKHMMKFADALGIKGSLEGPVQLGYLWSSHLFSVRDPNGNGAKAYSVSNYNEGNDPPVLIFAEQYVRPVRFGTFTKQFRNCNTAADCRIWDVGPGGGQVFLTATSEGNTTGKAFEIVNAPAGESVRGCEGIAISPATGIGMGAVSSADFAKKCTDPASFVMIAKNYRGGGKTDWFVPSLDELVAATTNGAGFNFFWAMSSSADPYRVTNYLKDVTARDSSISVSGGTNKRPILPVRFIP